MARSVGLPLAATVAVTPRLNIAPGQTVAALSRDSLVEMRWGLIPVGRVNARGRPVMETIVNARAETLFDKSAFAGTGRAVIFADGWYEWTGSRGRKRPWRIRPTDGGLLGFAAISDTWRAPNGRVLEQAAIVTCAPNTDVRAYHDRMGVLLDPADWPRWPHLPAAEAKTLLRPWPDGRLIVEAADGVDWQAP